MGPVLVVLFEVVRSGCVLRLCVVVACWRLCVRGCVVFVVVLVVCLLVAVACVCVCLCFVVAFCWLRIVCVRDVVC